MLTIAELVELIADVLRVGVQHVRTGHSICEENTVFQPVTVTCNF